MTSRRAARAAVSVGGALLLLWTAPVPSHAAAPTAGGAANAAASSPVQAGTPSDPLSYLPAPSRATVQARLDRAASVRRQVASGSYLHAVQAVLGENGSAVPATPPLPEPSTSDRQRVSSLPEPLRAPIAGLYAAVWRASQDIGSIPVSEIRAELEEIHDAEMAAPAERFAAAGTPGGIGRHGVEAPPLPQVDPFTGLSLRPTTAAAVQHDPAAALLIAEALDTYLPEIEQAKGSAPDRAGDGVTGCDMLDQTPGLCVGGSGDNTYTQDEMLLIDLGGNNTYDNGAGAAPFALGGAAGGQTEPVSVNVDVGGGNDTYNAPLSALGTATTPLVMGQGAAVTGGLGFSVNVSGNDTYNAAVTSPPPPDPNGGTHYVDALAQGAAIVGAGYLFDGGGNDAFSVTVPRLAHEGSFVIDAQGGSEGFVGGVGALVVTGGGSDTYTITGGGANAPQRAFVFVIENVQGATDGDGTEALLFDDGGTDSYTVASRSDDAPPMSPSAYFTSQEYQVWAQGSAVLGTAMLLEGSGTHAYTTAFDMENGADNGSIVSAQGSAGLAGSALLQDRGSGNTYDVESLMHHQQTVTVGDSCGCTGARLNLDFGAGDDPETLDETYVDWPEFVEAQGTGFNGVGILDNAGAATYRAVATANVDVTLQDELSQPQQAASLDVQGWDGPVLAAQGAEELGYPAETPTVGTLINHSGEASYTAVTGDSVRATATSLHGPAPVVKARSGFQWNAAAQGAGIWSAVPSNGQTAALLDMGGPDDTLSVVQDSSVTTVPDSGHGIDPGGFWMPSQGAGDPGILVVAGATPTIVASPANGVCPTSPSPRGFGSWVACDLETNPAENADLDHQSFDWLGGFYQPGHAGGDAPNATGSSPLLTLSAPAAAADESTIPVTVSLRDAANHPMAGQPVHVSLQGGLPINDVGSPAPDQGDQWINFGQVTLTTGPDGTVSGALPVDLTGVVGGPPSTDVMSSYRVVATYDGANGIYPHHVGSTITLSDGGPATSVPEAPLALLLVPAGVAMVGAGGRRRHGRRTRPGS